MNPTIIRYRSIGPKITFSAENSAIHLGDRKATKKRLQKQQLTLHNSLCGAVSLGQVKSQKNAKTAKLDISSDNVTYFVGIECSSYVKIALFVITSLF